MARVEADVVIPRGTIRRFSIAGGFNGLIFWILWELVHFMAGDKFLTLSWASAWVVSSLIAHMIHRNFTFDGRRDIKVTALGALSVYAFGLFGSTITFDVALDLVEFPIRLLFLLNYLGWGLFTWASMRFFVFGYSETQPIQD